MNNSETDNIEYKLESDYTPEQIAEIKKEQLSKLENMIDEQIQNSSEEINLYSLIFLENMIVDILKMPKYYLNVNSITKKIDALVNKAPCSSDLDIQAKELLIECNKCLRKDHTISMSLETQLHNIKLEYYRTTNL